MTDDAAAELQALRARAYGPDADILRDPVAYDRLQELEAQLRSEQRGPERSGAVPGTSSVASSTEGGAPSSAAAAAGTGDQESAGTAVPRSTERASESGARAAWSPLTRVPPLARAFWLISVMAVATLAASVTWGLASIPVISEGSGARQIAALDPDPSATAPPFGNTDTPPVGFQFAGYTLITATNSSDGVDSEHRRTRSTDAVSTERCSKCSNHRSL